MGDAARCAEGGCAAGGAVGGCGKKGACGAAAGPDPPPPPPQPPPPQQEPPQYYQALPRKGCNRPACVCPKTVQRERMRAIFQELDVGGDGRLGVDDLLLAARAGHAPLTRAGAEALVRKYDRIGDGLVAEWEFVESMLEREAEVSSAFQKLQRLAGSGEGGQSFLTSGLRHALSELGLKVTNDELRRFAAELDRDGDGQVTMAEFRRFAVFLPSANPRACFEHLHHFHQMDHADGHCAPPAEVRTDGRGFAEQLAEKVLAAGVAGVCSRTATAPVDRLKVLMQAGAGDRTLGGGGMFAGLRSIYQDGGARAFFRGNGANCVKIAPETALKFVTFDVYKSAIARDPSCPTAAERFVAGGAAGATSQLGIYPMEIAKTRLALAAPGTYAGIGGCLRDVAHAEGAKGLFAGAGASVVGIIPYAAIDLAVNSLLKEQVSARYERAGAEPGVALLLGCGMVSSTCAMLVTYPLNLIRTRLQAMGLPGAPQYKGPVDVGRKVVASDGWTGLYRGILPNMAKVLPATSISYAIYGRVCQAFQHRDAAA